MARCKIYLFTHKRNNLLPRAIASLRNQTLTDWICEVHNDDPLDLFPAQYIAQLNDERLVVKNHPENLGGVRSFNLAFAGCAETYACILEDDNWWEPCYLAEMTALLDGNPHLDMAWSNMRVWQENPDNSWTDTGTTTWPNQENTWFTWPQQRQVIGNLHSNGAMIYRGNSAARHLVPDNTLFNAVELVRERTFTHPVCLVAKPLANFAITRQTTRTNNRLQWISYQIMLLASYVKTSAEPEEAFAESLRYHRSLRPTPIANFFLTNFLLLKINSLYRLLTLGDWIAVGKWLVRNGGKLRWMKKHLAIHQNVYSFLLQHTANRHQEAKEKDTAINQTNFI